MLAALVVLVLAGPPTAIPVGEGFLMPTKYRTLARYQLAIGAEQEYPKLYRAAIENSRRRPPRPLRVLHVIVREIDAPIEDKGGNKAQATSKMTSAEINRCREWFDNYCNLVFTYTAGALKVEPTELLLEDAVHRLEPMGEGKYWMSAYGATEGIENNIKANYYDSICFYYKKPENMEAGLLGGALGRDSGIRGSAIWTQWITDWDEAPSTFSGAAVVSLHEWLHNISYYAHRVMAYTAVPDCHAAEEYGYWDTDGGYRQWQAWNRDLMLRLIPRAFWYKLDTRSDELPEAAAPINSGVECGGLFSWRDVGADWHARLPELKDADLQKLTGISDLRLVTYQEKANSHVVYRLSTSTNASSPIYNGQLNSLEIKLDNVLSVARTDVKSVKTDPLGGYATAPLEGMMVLRTSQSGDRRDLVVVRADIAPYVLPLLRVKGRNAVDSIVGFIHRQDPGEKQQLLLIAAQVDFGEKLPADELAAIGVAP